MPLFEGIPLITPADENDKPGGRAPELSFQLYGSTPPEAFRVVEYATPTFPFAKVVVVSASGLA